MKDPLDSKTLDFDLVNIAKQMLWLDLRDQAIKSYIAMRALASALDSIGWPARSHKLHERAEALRDAVAKIDESRERT